MTNYKVVQDNITSTLDKDPTVDIKTEVGVESGHLDILARNPGEGWNLVAWLDTQGEMGLSRSAEHVEGLSTDQDGYIKIDR